MKRTWSKGLICLLAAALIFGSWGFTAGAEDADAGTGAAIQAVTETGTGLLGAYYNNEDFTDFYMYRKDARIDFDYGNGSPDPGMDGESFSVRWTGYVQPEFSETYTFTSKTDDGVRLWVNGTQLIDKWVGQAPTEWSGSIDLQAGQKYEITMEYYEGCCGAFAQLMWSSPSTPKQVIPQERLYLPAMDDSEAPSVPAGLAGISTSPSLVYLSWNPSTDNQQLSGYKVFRDGVLIGTTSRTNLSAVGLTPNTTYSFAVQAEDLAGNLSAMSEPVSVTTKEYVLDPNPGKLLAGDSFDTNAGMLKGVNTGKGWSAAWEVQNGDASIPGYNVQDSQPVVYNGLYQKGNYAIGGKAYLTAFRSLDVRSEGPFADYLVNGKIGKAGKSLWISGLLRKDANNDDQLAIGLNYPDTKMEFGYFSGDSNRSGVRYWSLRFGGKVYVSDVPLVVGETALLAVELQFGEPNVANLYVNPVSLGVNSYMVPDAQAVYSGSAAFSSVHIYGGANTNNGSIDEIRVGTSFASVTPTFFDDAPPSVPQNLRSPKKNDSSISLEWDAATDNVGVSSYKLYQGGTQIAEMAGTSYLVKNLVKNTAYSFTVRALDSEGNLSEASSALEVTTDAEPADNTRYNFENGETHGFKHLGGAPVTVALDSTHVYKGEGALKVSFGIGAQPAAVGIDVVDPLIKNGKTVSFMVFIPEGSTFSLQPFVFGAGWSWNGGFYESQYLNKNAWNKIEVKMENGTSPSPWLGMFIHSDQPGEFWIDSVNYTGYGEPDTEAPTAPVNLQSTSQTDNMAALTWQAATDNIQVASYEVYVDGALVGTTANLYYTVLGLNPSTAYEITVKAKDEAGNISVGSNVVTLTTDPGYMKLNGNIFGSEPASAGLSYENAFDGNGSTYFESKNDSGGYAGMDLGEGMGKRLTKVRFQTRDGFADRMNGGKIQGSVDGVEYATIYTIRNAAAGWNEVRMVHPRAFRYFRYLSPTYGYGNVAELEFYGEDGDMEAPGIPQGLAVSSTGATSVSLSWQPASDNVGVTEYIVYADGVEAGRTALTAYTVKGLESDRTYAFTVRAADAVGNLSDSSAVVEATTIPSTVAVSAASLQEEDEAYWVTLKGTVSSGAGQSVTLEVTSPSGETIYLGEVTSGFKGSFVLGFYVEQAESGDYVLTAGGAGVKEPGSALFKLAAGDSSAPVGAISINDNAPYTKSVNVELKLTAIDDQGGAVQAQVSSNGTDWSEWTALNASLPYVLGGADGEKVVYVRYKDEAGNVSETYNDSIVLDRVAPVIVFGGLEESYTAAAQIHITCEATDVMSGVADSDCAPIQGKGYELGAGTHSYTFTATDLAGNVTTVKISFTVVAKISDLSALTKQFVTNKNLQHPLTQKLAAAQASQDSGNKEEMAGQLKAFINQVNAKTGKGITKEHAAILIKLAQSLMKQ